jgi:hypothetical protein
MFAWLVNLFLYLKEMKSSFFFPRLDSTLNKSQLLYYTTTNINTTLIICSLIIKPFHSFNLRKLYFTKNFIYLLSFFFLSNSIINIYSLVILRFISLYEFHVIYFQEAFIETFLYSGLKVSICKDLRAGYHLRQKYFQIKNNSYRGNHPQIQFLTYFRWKIIQNYSICIRQSSYIR